MNSNMYYAMNKRDDLCFKIARKKLSKADKKRKDLLVKSVHNKQTNSPAPAAPQSPPAVNSKDSSVFNITTAAT